MKGVVKESQPTRIPWSSHVVSQSPDTTKEAFKFNPTTVIFCGSVKDKDAHIRTLKSCWHFDLLVTETFDHFDFWHFPQCCVKPILPRRVVSKQHWHLSSCVLYLELNLGESGSIKNHLLHHHNGAIERRDQSLDEFLFYVRGNQSKRNGNTQSSSLWPFWLLNDTQSEVRERLCVFLFPALSDSGLRDCDTNSHKASITEMNMSVSDGPRGQAARTPVVLASSRFHSLTPSCLS